jgi:hypothetical protein
MLGLELAQHADVASDGGRRREVGEIEDQQLFGRIATQNGSFTTSVRPLSRSRIWVVVM